MLEVFWRWEKYERGALKGTKIFGAMFGIKLGDLVWMSMRQSSTKCQATNSYTSTGHRTVMGKNHTIKQAVKVPKRNDDKLYIKDENQPIEKT